MNTYRHDAVDFDSKQWKAFRLGLRLANSHLGLGIMVGFYLSWLLIIGVTALVVLIPVMLAGKTEVFERVLNAVALYSFVLPLALMAAITWTVKFFSRLLWCTIPQPSTATLLAIISVTGRISVLFGIGYVLLSGEPFGKSLLLPQIVACSAIAWIGLAAERGFFRTLWRHFIPVADPVSPGNQISNTLENIDEGVEVSAQKKSIFKRDVGEWFKRRYPRSHKLVVWIGLPVAYVVLSSMGNNGPGSVAEGILRYAVIFPAILQVFWIPSQDVNELVVVFSPKSAQEGIPA